MPKRHSRPIRRLHQGKAIEINSGMNKNHPRVKERKKGDQFERDSRALRLKKLHSERLKYEKGEITSLAFNMGQEAQLFVKKYYKSNQMPRTISEVERAINNQKAFIRLMREQLAKSKQREPYWAKPKDHPKVIEQGKSDQAMNIERYQHSIKDLETELDWMRALHARMVIDKNLERRK